MNRAYTCKTYTSRLKGLVHLTMCPCKSSNLPRKQSLPCIGTVQLSLAQAVQGSSLINNLVTGFPQDPIAIHVSSTRHAYYFGGVVNGVRKHGIPRVHALLYSACITTFIMSIRLVRLYILNCLSPRMYMSCCTLPVSPMLYYRYNNSPK